MDERSITKSVRSKLEERGFYIIKHEDHSTIGVPDMSITGNGTTLWVEDKYFEGSTLKVFLNARKIASKKRYSQLVTLVNLWRKGNATYWIYQNVNGKVMIGSCTPMDVLRAWSTNSLVKIENVMELSEWVKEFQMPN